MTAKKGPRKGDRSAMLPVKPYIYKWLINRQGYKDILLINHRFIPYYPRNTHRIYQYFKNEQKYPTIRISAYYPHKRALYSFVEFLELWFSQEMLTYVRIATVLDVPAQRAVKDFLRLCHITEDELALATAYKRWQRAGMQNLPGVKFM